MPAITLYSKNCRTKDSYEADGYTIIELSGGTVGLYEPPVTLPNGTVVQNPITSHETKACCELLGYTFDITTQKCRWALDNSELFKIVLNPEGNSSTLFNVEPNETCELEISFDYLFVFECDKLLEAKAKAIGVTNTNVSTLDELESSANTLTIECDFYQSIIDDADKTPYVIQYLAPGVVGPNGTFIPANSSLYYGGNLPPLAYGIFNPNVVTYCLTNLGVQEWISWIGSFGNLWHTTYGTDPNHYTNAEVESFIKSEPNLGDYHTTTCNYSIYDRERAEDTISKFTPKVKACKDELDILQASISGITSGITTSIYTPEAPCTTYIDMFEQFETSFTLEVESTGQTKILTSVYEEPIMNIGSGSLYNYIDSASGKTGIIISGNTGLMPTLADSQLLNSNPDLCTQIRDNLVTDLFNQYLETNSLPATQQEQVEIFSGLTGWYQSCWLNYKTTITDQLVLDAIENRNINITMSIKNSCMDFTILLDRIKMNKSCTKVDNIKKFISEPPKFELTKIPDNKKSWLSNEETDKRFFDLKHRGTEYNTNHHKLVINTKEVDLNLSPSRAVEQDVWCYISDNNCILDGCVSIENEYKTFSCPSGYTLDVDGDSCTELTVTAATSGATTYTIGTGVGLTTSVHYLSRGTIFVEDITDKQWPIYWTGTPNDKWVGPYYNTEYLTDSSGNYLNHSGFGINKFSDGTLQYSSPDAFSGVRSKFGKYNTDIIAGVLNPNILWGGTNGSVSASTFNNVTSTNSAGRLLNASVWSNPGTLPVKEWIGLSYCLELTKTKSYRLGFAADDKTRIKINGEYLINPDTTPSYDANIHNNFNISYSRSIQSYVVMGIKLSAGKNIIEIEGYNNISGTAGFVCEIYDASESQLRNMRFESELDSVRIFSTIDKVGQTFDLGELSAYSCPVGYSLDTCTSGSTVCTKIDRITREDEQSNEYCPCDGFPLIIKGYENKTIELPLTPSIVTISSASSCSTGIPTTATTTTNFVCNDIATLVNNYGTTTTLKPINVANGGTAYAIGTGTTTSFDGFWITEENNGTIGVYISKWISGTTNTQENVSSQVNETCCEVIDDAFEIYANMFNQGINTYPNATWDKNTNKCVYSRCGDNGCIDLDDVLTTELSQIDTVNEFVSTLSSELIDVKNRQTISSYPTLRMLYDRYNTRSLEFCGINSSKYDYSDMDKFGQTVGSYWIDLIEQVVPATTIWGSTYAYKNTVFDQQKFNYKRGNLYLCEPPPPPPPAVSLPQFDFLVLEFKWDINIGGNDLDILTSIQGTNDAVLLNSFGKPDGPKGPDGNYIGYNIGTYYNDALNNNITNPNPTKYVGNSPTTPFMIWGGDCIGCAASSEQVLIDFKQLTLEYPSLANGGTSDELSAELKAYWQGLRKTDTGELVINMTTYLGGTMSLNNNYGFSNSGGTSTASTFKTNTQSTSITSAGLLGEIKYNKNTKKAVLIDANATTVPTTISTTPSPGVATSTFKPLALASNSTVSVISQVLPSPIVTTGTTSTLITLQPSITRCNGVWIKDTGCESDFLGEVTTIDINGAIIPS